MNRLTMGQFSKVLLAINNAHTVPQRDLDCRPGICGLNKVYGLNCPTPSPSLCSICGNYIIRLLYLVPSMCNTKLHGIHTHNIDLIHTLTQHQADPETIYH